MLLSHTLWPHGPGSGLGAEKTRTKEESPKELTVKKDEVNR